jgi:Ca-activated chloride channel family protein
MIKWVHLNYLYFLIAVPVFFVIMVIMMIAKQRLLSRFADHHLIVRLTRTVERRLQVSKSILIMLGFGLIVIGLARPKWGEKLQVYEGRGIDIVIALDASNSMLATDIKPDRLTRAKTEIASLIENFSTDRIAITAFAGECYIMCPLTTDTDAAKLFLDIISPDVVPKPGTNLEKALLVSNSMFDPSENAYKALIVFTDGDNLTGNPLPAAEKIRDEGVKLFTIGVGTIEGAPIPQKDENGNFIGYKKDKEEKIVMSRLGERQLIILSKATNGRYFRTEGQYTSRLLDELAAIKKKDIGGSEYVEYEERYQYFLIPAFVLILLGTALSDRKGRWIR